MSTKHPGSDEGMDMRHIVIAFTALACIGICCPPVAAEDLWPVAFNSMLDRFQADGMPDEVRPHARDYVAWEKTVGSRGYSSIQETRTFVEFKLPNRATGGRVTLEFDVHRYNTPNTVPQQLAIAYYPGNGTIELDDWSRPATDLGTTRWIKGFRRDKGNRGEAVRMSLDVTSVVNGAIGQSSHLGFSFRKNDCSVIDPRDPLGYSTLNTIGKCRLKFEPANAPH